MDTIKIRPVNLYRLSQITEKSDSGIEFCKDVGLIPKQVNCPTCSAILEKPYYIKNRKSTQIRYQCNKCSCRGSGKKIQSVWSQKTGFQGVTLLCRSPYFWHMLLFTKCLTKTQFMRWVLVLHVIKDLLKLSLHQERQYVTTRDIVGTFANKLFKITLVTR